MGKLMFTAVAVVGLGLGLATAAPASADERSYLTDLANNDFTGPTNIALQMGYEICSDIDNGVPRTATVKAIYENTGDAIEVEDAQYIYDAAVIHLC
jgi:uncharacterized protein DUF732